MNVSENLACASSGNSLRWNRIDWGHAHRAVRKLQTRIVKATKDNTVVAGSNRSLKGLSRIRGNSYVRF